ncbi:MAG: restriction endonuclease subunit S [Proteobacteria bacterium]|nr:restriction endonuclease subunit S [Pseudomonadota bacterium]MBI3497990.1 restriction endonuclease subunit S [Pseudomonadota bacterium]
MIDGLRPYPEMSPTGLPWLAELPTAWEVHRAKYSFREVDDRSEEGGEELLSVSHKTGVTPRSQKNITMFMAESYEGHKVCRPGDVVVNTMWAWMAAIGVSRHVGIVSPAYGIYRPRTTNQFEPKYLDYLLRTEVYRAEYVRSSRGITTSRLRLYPPDFLNIPFVQPPLDEQRLIVRFLDWHGAQTAKLIRAKKKLIALLDDQKQAIVHRAVTRGFDPSVKLKPSSIHWLGDVPEGWEVIPFKRCIGFQEGPGIMALDFRDVGIPLLRIAGLHGDEATLRGCNFLDPDMVDKRWPHFRVQEGDYLLSSSASTGKICLATKVVEGAIPYTGIIRLWPISSNVSMPFLKYLISARPFQDQLDAAKSGVAIEHFGPTHLKRILICLPSRSEQDVLAQHIAETTVRFDIAATAVEREIALLQEFRALLIADVVTGKLDVRAATASLPEITEAEPIDEIAADDLEEEVGDNENEEVAA